MEREIENEGGERERVHMKGASEKGKKEHFGGRERRKKEKTYYCQQTNTYMQSVSFCWVLKDVVEVQWHHHLLKGKKIGIMRLNGG